MSATVLPLMALAIDKSLVNSFDWWSESLGIRVTSLSKDSIFHYHPAYRSLPLGTAHALAGYANRPHGTYILRTYHTQYRFEANNYLSHKFRRYGANI